MAGLIDLGGQIAVVTGGGRGPGCRFARTLAAAGCSVAVIARSTAELAETVALIEQSGGKACAFPADVTDFGVVSETFASIGGSLGPVDLLVNNAGILGPPGPFAESKIEDT